MGSVKRFICWFLTRSWPQGAKEYVCVESETADLKTLWLRYYRTRKFRNAYAAGQTVTINLNYCVHSSEPIHEFHQEIVASIEATEIVIGAPAQVSFESEPLFKNGERVAYNFRVLIQFSQEITKRKQAHAS